MSRHAILILSPDPLAAALLGAAVELAGHHAHFARAQESGRDALRRARPDLLLLDGDDRDSCDDMIIGPALMTGARVVLFRARGAGSDAARLAAERDLTVLVLPDDVERLAELLAAPR